MFQSECFKICHTFGIRQSTYFSFLISHENTEHILNTFHWKHFIKQKVIYFWRVLILCYFCGEERKERHIATPTFRRFCYWSTSSHTQPSFPASFQIQVLSIDSSSIYSPIHLGNGFFFGRIMMREKRRGGTSSFGKDLLPPQEVWRKE